MRKLAALFLFIIIFLLGCSRANDNSNSLFHSVNTELTKQEGLEQWKLSLVPTINSLGQQGYDLGFQNSSDASVNSVTVYYRVDTKEKLSGPTIKADSQTRISKLDPNEKITLSDLSLPINSLLQVEVDWLVGSTIRKGTGTFQITESK